MRGVFHGRWKSSLPDISRANRREAPSDAASATARQRASPAAPSRNDLVREASARSIIRSTVCNGRCRTVHFPISNVVMPKLFQYIQPAFILVPDPQRAIGAVSILLGEFGNWWAKDSELRSTAVYVNRDFKRHVEQPTPFWKSEFQD